MILLLGSKDELAAVPVDVPKFIEDMNESELASAVSVQLIRDSLPIG